MRSVEVAMVVYSVCECECTEGHSQNCEPCTVFLSPNSEAFGHERDKGICRNQSVGQ